MKCLSRVLLPLWLVLCFVLMPSAVDAADVKKAGRNDTVEIFVTSWCPYCQKLEAYLKSKNIRFKRYDIDSDKRGAEIHEKLGGGGVPVTRIGGSIVVRGFDIEGIEAALSASRGADSTSKPLATT